MRNDCVGRNCRVVQGRMHQFQGLGTTHMNLTDEKGNMEALKFRIHHMTIKIVNGKACVFYKEFMRDEHLLPGDGQGWPVFLDGASLDLSELVVMPTLAVANMVEIEKNIKVGNFLTVLSALSSFNFLQLDQLMTLSARLPVCLLTASQRFQPVALNLCCPNAGEYQSMEKYTQGS
jgi:hypothetical protein